MRRIAFLEPARVAVIEAVAIVERRGNGRMKASRGRPVQPLAGLNVVLRVVWRRAAGIAVAQSVEQVIRCAVFLKYHNNVLKSRDLRLR